MKNKIKSELSLAVAQASKAEILFWNIVRVLLVSGLFVSETPSRFIFIAGAFFLSFGVSVCHFVFKKDSFFGKISYRAQTLICVSAFCGAFVGKILGVLEKYPDYDIFLHILAGCVGVCIGYYITVALNEPKTKNEIFFTAFSSLVISSSITCLREVAEFLYDFWMGTNLVHVDLVPDDHWLYRLFGKGMTELIPNQQRILDTDEDMALAIFSAFISMTVLFLYLRIENKAVYSAEKQKCEISFKGILQKIRKKFCAEADKIRKDCAQWEVTLWWCVRILMVYAAFNMPNVAEAILLSANLLGTFAITLLHFATSERNPLNKLSYRVQTAVTIMVFLGSYCGNYVFVYNILGRFDLFLHFISGALSVTGGYYLSRTLIEIRTKKQAQLSAIFALCFSGLVIPTHEIVEFIGDFIWGTTNQGFNWGPTSESFFFKVFGQGVGNTQLYYLFDTMYDMLLAISMSLIAFVILYIGLIYKVKKQEKTKLPDARQFTVDKVGKI